MFSAVGLSCAALNANGIEYFCPRSDTTLQFGYADQNGGDMLFEASGSLRSDFTSGRIELGSCSTAEFFCKQVSQQHILVPKSIAYFLVVPRSVQVGHRYSFGKVSIETRFASVTTDPNNIVGQVTIWQPIMGQRVGMELTIREHRGVLFWDGLPSLTGKTGGKDICILQSEAGLFPDVQLADPNVDAAD